MESKRFGNSVVVRLDRGEEIVESLKRVCEEHGIKLGVITGIGATDKVEVGLFDPVKKEYHSKPFSQNFEISPLCGNVSKMKGETYLHLHINLCDAKQRSFGGHLNKAVVSATFEAVIQVIEGELDRGFSEEIGLNLFKF